MKAYGVNLVFRWLYPSIQGVSIVQVQTSTMYGKCTETGGK